MNERQPSKINSEKSKQMGFSFSDHTIVSNKKEKTVEKSPSNKGSSKKYSVRGERFTVIIY